MENIPEMLSRLNTFCLSAEPRLVVFKDAKLFDSQSDQQRLQEQIVEAVASDRIDRAAKVFLALCGRLAVPVENFTSQAVPDELQPLEMEIGSDAVGRLLLYCQQQGWSAQSGETNLDALMRAFERGFPPRHTLLITVYSKAPKNRKLYKAIQTHGVIVDCSVPAGERRADKLAQESVLRQTLEEMLSAARKKLAPSLLGTLIELTGFDLPNFRDNVEKLIAFTGGRAEITAADIQTLLRKTKTDPLYELTNAVAERNLNKAVGCLGGLLRAEWHPLQIIAALANQVRKLLVAKDFAVSASGHCWSRGISYAQFQSQVLPVIQKHDVQVSEQMAAWPSPSAGTKKNAARTASSKGSSELALAANPHNAFPIYQTLLKSENFTLPELVAVMHRINDADVRLKSTGQDPTQVLTALLLAICAPSTNRARPLMSKKKKDV
jgi:DNA polymerase-3 subunit delta